MGTSINPTDEPAPPRDDQTPPNATRFWTSWSPETVLQRAPNLTLIAMLAIAALLMLRPDIRGNDGVQNYAYLRSLFFDRDLNFTNEYQNYYTEEPRWFNYREVPRDHVTNLPVNSYGIGNAVLWAPFIFLAHTLGLLANSLGAALVLDGYSPLYEAAVAVASCSYASAAILIIFSILRRHFDTSRAFFAVLLIWLASPLLFYMYFHTSMSHANSFFLATLLFWLYLGGDGLGRWAFMGAISALLVMTRLQDVAILAFLAAGEGVRLWRDRSATSPDSDSASPLPSRCLRYSIFAAAGILAFIPQFLAWRVLQGSPFSGPRVYMIDGVLTPWFPRYLPLALFSPFHGLFHWHPALLLGGIGLFIGMRRDLWFRMIALGGFAGAAWMIGSWSVWHASAAFGQRMFISALPFLAVGAAAVLAGPSKWKLTARGLILFAILWNFGLLAQYGLPLIPRQAPVPITTIARNNLIELPRLVLQKLGAI